jgi:hypothetical protein
MLSKNALRDLDENGFVVIPGPFESGEMPRVSEAYDSVVSSASPDDIRIGSSTTRVNAFVDPEQGLSALYTHPPLLEAAGHIIGGPFKLSSMLARTLHPNSSAQRLHVDFKKDEERFPLAGFIFMVDEFCADNGATGFLPGSHRWQTTPNDLTDEALANHDHKIQIARGKAGSLIVFNGSVWHGYTANSTSTARRSIQGAFIPRDARPATDFKARVDHKALRQNTLIAKYLLGL